MTETPRERRHQRTKDAILQAAMNIIREKGADKLSLRAVARRIDYSPAGLYEYFSGKDDIIDAICAEADGRLTRYLRDVDESLPPDEYLVELGLAYIAFATQNPEHFKFLFNNNEVELTEEELEQATSIKDADHDANFTILVKAIERGIEAGIITAKDNFDVIDIAYSMWSLVHGMAILQVQYLRSFPLDYANVNREAIHAFIRGLRG